MTGRIPEKFIDELLTRIDIVDVIDSRVPLKKAGKDYKACCPFHEEKTPSFTVSQVKQFYYCFGCGARGTAVGFLMEYERLSFPEAIEDLARMAGMTVPRETQPGASFKESQTDALLSVIKQADAYYRRQLREHPQAQEAIDYLKGRGLTGEVAAHFGFGYAPEGWDNLIQSLGGESRAPMNLLEQAGLVAKRDHGGHYDRFRHRIMFPIHDYRGRVVGFGGRVLGEGEPKYLNSPETPLFHKGRELYGLYKHRDTLRRLGRVVVVEGYMDVVALAQFGVDYAVGTLGTATTREHLERLFRLVPKVVFCFDGDNAGRRAAWRALEQALPMMQDGREVDFLFLPEGDDPDSYVRREGKDGFEGLVEKATPITDYLLSELGDQVDRSHREGRARFVELARPLVEQMPEGVLRGMLEQHLSDSVGGIALSWASKPLKSTEKTPLNSHRQRPRSAGGPQKPPSLVRTAIAMVLRQPSVARGAADIGYLEYLDSSGVPLLRRLIEIVQDEDTGNSAVLIERFRGEPDEAHLNKLMAWDHPMLEGDLEAGFSDLLAQLRREALKQRTEQLAAKSRFAVLDDTEKEEFRRLIQERNSGPGKTEPTH